jgi:predicted nucleic acid-binding protein
VKDCVIVDTGPIVAFLNRAEPTHRWVVQQFQRLAPPLLTCEPVLTEAMFLLEDDGCDATKVLDLLEAGVLEIGISAEDEARPIRQLMMRFKNVPMSFADALLVRLTELRERPRIFTLDSDFHIYRRHGRAVIPLLTHAG